MSKGFGSMIDDIKNRDSDDPVGMKSKKNKSDENTKPKRSGGFDGIIDDIKDRDSDDPTGTVSKKKDKPEQKSDKKRGGFDGIIDDIRDRDEDDPAGNTPKKKSTEKNNDSDDDEKTPLDGISKSTSSLLSAGIGTMVGISVMKGMNGLMNNMDK